MRIERSLRGRRAPPAAPRRRPDLWAFWLVAAGPALGLALWAAPRQDVAALQDELVRDANALAAATYPRPVHADRPVPGTLGEALRVHLPPFEAEARASADDSPAREALRAVVAGERPVTAIPARFGAALARLGPDLDALLAGTRAERADFPEAADRMLPADGATWGAYAFAARLAGARIRLGVAAGDLEGATRDCLDALALARDAAIVRGLLGMITAEGVVRTVGPPCAEAASRLPAGRAAALAGRVRAMRAALPPYSAVVARELVEMELIASAVLLDPDDRRRLDPRIARQLSEAVAAPAWWERPVIRDGWRDRRRAGEAIVRASDLPLEAREARYALVKASLSRRLDWFSTMFPVDAYARWGRRADALALRLDALVLAAEASRHRAGRGRWPASVAELAAAGALSPAEAARLGAATLAPEGARALVIRLPLPQGDREKDPAEVTLRAAAR
jgi:hypothetical protein